MRGAYLTVILWPDDTWTNERKATFLSDCTGLDLITARQRVASPAPVIVGEFDPAVAEIACHEFVRNRGAAFAPSLEQIEALGETRAVRDIQVRHAGLYLDLWRDDPITITRGSIDVIVRASLSEKDLSAPKDPVIRTWGPETSGALAVGWGIGGSHGLAVGMAIASFDASVDDRKHRTRRSNRMDFHTRDGRVFHVNSDKFGFQVLGDQRAPTDNRNIDLLCELLTVLAPDATVDPYFELWRPPARSASIRLPRMHVNKDDPAFAFYSRWAALMYRHLIG